MIIASVFLKKIYFFRQVSAVNKLYPKINKVIIVQTSQKRFVIKIPTNIPTAVKNNAKPIILLIS